MLSNDLTLKKTPKFFCDCCDYKSSNKKDYKRHLETQKHSFNVFQSQLPEKPQKLYQCVCGKIYKDNSGLWRHKRQGCENISLDNIKITPKMFYDLLKQNNELQQKVVEITSVPSQIMNNSNNNNKTFNLQVFLNETCKEALNISEFVQSIQLQLSDLEDTARLGYVQGISNIFIKNLDGLDTHKRPIHCSDVKREILYIKEENQWTKNDINTALLQNAIKIVANKNIKQISEWVKINPECMDTESKKNDTYLKIVSNAMSGSTQQEQLININKIIKNLAKEVAIEKS